MACCLMEGWILGGVREHAVRCARPIKSACTSEGECGADLHVWFWFGSGLNKFVQLLIRSRNSSSRFVQSLANIVPDFIQIGSHSAKLLPNA